MAVKGMDKLRARAKAIPRNVRVATRRALETGAKEITSLQKSLVRDDTGDLKRSIGYTFGKYKPENANVRGVAAGGGLGDPDLSVTIHAGDAKAYYAAFVEFGTAPHEQPNNRINGGQHPGASAAPFFFPAYRALKRRAKGRITRAMNKAIRDGAKK